MKSDVCSTCMKCLLVAGYLQALIYFIIFLRNPNRKSYYYYLLGMDRYNHHLHGLCVKIPFGFIMLLEETSYWYTAFFGQFIVLAYGYATIRCLNEIK